MIKNLIFKAKNWLILIRHFFIDTIGLFKSIFIYLFRNIKRPGVFNGYHSLYFATLYANKRSINWKREWNQTGKQQGVIPFNETSLLVCSKLELDYFKKKHLINRKVKTKKVIRKAYYKTV
jgi:hypothetical protein